MTLSNGTHVIEPIEYFLRSIVCCDRLALYQRVIDLIKNNQKFSIIEALNSTLTAQINESGSELVDEIHENMIKHLVDLLLEYDVVVRGRNLAFLADLLEALNSLDDYDAHEYIIDTIDGTEGKPTYKLYQVLEIIKPFDEEEFSRTVKMCSLSLLDRVKDLHRRALEVVTMTDIVADDTDFTLLRKVVQGHTDLVVNRLLERGAISNKLPMSVITDIVKKDFEELELLDPKSVARELIAVYLVSGLKSPELLDGIREEMPNLISDDNAIAKVGVVLNGVYVEMTT